MEARITLWRLERAAFVSVRLAAAALGMKSFFVIVPDSWGRAGEN